MIKVLLLSFHDNREKNDCKYSLASLRLAAYVQDNKDIEISIETFDFGNIDDSIKHLISKINNREIDIVGISAYIWTWEIAKYISNNIKRKNDQTILIGGPEVLNRDLHGWVGDEIFVCGEGEQFLKKICEMKLELIQNAEILKNEKIANAIKLKGKYIVMKNCALAYKLPVFSDTFFTKLKITHYPQSYFYYETTRGCPYNCGYCGHKTRSKIASYDDAFVEGEIKYIGELGVQKVFIIDPILGGTPERGKHILKSFIKYSPNTELTAYLRPEYLDDEYLEILNKSNIEEMRIGIQTLNESVPEWIRYNNINKIVSVLPRLTATGIGWRAELIVGLPGDSIQGLKKSIKFLLNYVSPSYLYAYHLTVLKETKLYDMVDNLSNEWIKIDPIKFRAIECYSYSENEMIEMLNFSTLITSLYNRYTFTLDKKTYNKAPEYKKLDNLVNTLMANIGENKIISYSECEKYWAKTNVHD